uniref:SLC26A/SulP transporter domain-containing protein n=1 Tax=Panagrolaimus superbus TaxID=310955 RepID=A0A914Y7J6_9BILA
MFAVVALMVRDVISHQIPNSEDIIANMSTIDGGGVPLSARPDVQLVVTLTFLVGCVMIVMALLQIHMFASYLSESLISFTTAASIHVVLSQIPPLLGLEGVTERSGFLNVYFVVITTLLSQFYNFQTTYKMNILDKIQEG